MRANITKEYIALVMIGVSQDIIVATLENVQMVLMTYADAKH